jgi:hypothetical protein
MHLAKLALVTSVRSIQKASKYTQCCGFSSSFAWESVSAAPIRNPPAGTQTKTIPSTGEVQVWPTSVQAGPTLVSALGSAVFAEGVSVVWIVGDASTVLVGVAETEEDSVTVAVSVDAACSVDAEGRAFPLQEAEMAKSTMIVLRIEWKSLSFCLPVSQKVVAYL